jgi:diguanylate cyclase (GGDEF)-like protein
MLEAVKGSFKLKLVVWFALLALIPLGISLYGYDALAKRGEARRADGGLESALRGAVTGYAMRLEHATAEAARLARSPVLQRALRRRDTMTIARIIAPVDGGEVKGRGFDIGSTGTPAAVRSVNVVDRTGVLGKVSVGVPIDRRLLRSLGEALPEGDLLVAVRDGRIITGLGAGAPISLRPGQAERVDVGGVPFRGLSTAYLASPDGLSFVALAPQSAIDARARSSERGIASALLGSLVLFAAVAYLLGRSIVQTLRRLRDAAEAVAQGRFSERVDVPGHDEFAQLGHAFNDMAAQLEQRLIEVETERARVREAIARLGEALVATHDSRELLRVVAESAVEAVRADGAIVTVARGEAVRIGDPDGPGERIAFPLRTGSADFGHLVLVAASFDVEQIEMARALASQAVVALDNAQLHRLVQQQALVDSLTGLANRRSLEDSLRFELARVKRFGGDVCVVFFDLDGFKDLNDHWGHLFGDEVLCRVASALRATVREGDVAGRWGGDEFAIVLPGTSSEGGARLAELVRRLVAGEVLVAPDGDEVRLTASFGLAAASDGVELGELIAAADSALYEAKRGGKNCVVVTAPHMV